MSGPNGGWEGGSGISSLRGINQAFIRPRVRYTWVRGWAFLKIDTSLFFTAPFALQVTVVEKKGGQLLGERKGDQAGENEFSFFFDMYMCGHIFFLLVPS